MIFIFLSPILSINCPCNHKSLYGVPQEFHTGLTINRSGILYSNVPASEDSICLRESQEQLPTIMMIDVPPEGYVSTKHSVEEDRNHTHDDQPNCTDKYDVVQNPAKIFCGRVYPVEFLE